MSRRVGPEETFNEDLGMFALPVHNGAPTSRAAAGAIKPSADSLRQRVYEYVALCGENGATREECEIALELSGSTVRPRVVELMNAGRLREVPETTRATSAGRQARILVAKR